LWLWRIVLENFNLKFSTSC